jgi:hypothetical protein
MERLSRLQLQEAANNQMENNAPTIEGIQKLKSKDIRIHYNTLKEAEQLRKLKWNQAYDGLKIRQTKYGIVMTGISTDSIKPEISRIRKRSKT